MQRIIGGSIALGIALACATASAQGKIDNIGNAGGIVIGAERLAGFYVTKENVQSEESQTVGGTTVTSKSEVDATTTTFAIFGHDPQSPTQLPRLALDYFVIDGLSFGASFIYLTTSGDAEGEASVSSGGQTTTQDIDEKLPTESALVVNPRIGYAIAFNETVGLWPRIGFSYERIVREQEDTITDGQGNEVGTAKQTATTSLTHLTLEGLLFVSPFTGFAFVGGPFVDVGLGGSTKIETDIPNQNVEDQDFDDKVTAYGLTIGIAGYFDTQ